MSEHEFKSRAEKRRLEHFAKEKGMTLEEYLQFLKKRAQRKEKK